MKKFVTILALCACLLSSCAQKNEGVILRFDENGEFKILQLTDLHYVYKDSRSDIMFERMEELLDFEKPDLVVFTGDLIYAPPADSAYLDILSHITRRNLPFAICFGNHDDNWGISNTELYDLVRTIPGNLFPDRGDNPSPDYTVSILGHDSDELAALLYCFDSGTYLYEYQMYEPVHTDQVCWYYNTSKAFTKANEGEPVPSLAFLHIPFPEYRAELPRVGFFGEPVCDPQLNSGLFNAMLECGDVMGVFCGHDHNNDYAINNRGILLAYGRYSGGDTVYNDIPNGGRVIVLKKGSRHFTTWVTLKGGERIDYLEY
ncbi:MAG: metallophosphoesterase family protein [Candidatus Cryptobacteroides sp.]